MSPPALNHDLNTYLAVSLAPASPLLRDPSLLARGHPDVRYEGIVGALADVQLLSVPRARWTEVQADVLGWLREREGVVNVQVQDPPRARAKRGGDSEEL